ncbi:SDR family NAD(P)-dependent oxidoreductase [Microbacterium sp.]|uniref:SDR family NAD(P)-dependent oxidoreductase n=1 Tax=Microbacterium sp. TaxID=51671 RepID=UPI0039E2D16B
MTSINDPDAVGPDAWAGRVAVVTGAAGAMGSQVVADLLSRGVLVAGFDRTDALERLGDIAAGTPGRFLGIDVDITSRAAVQDAFTRVDDELGPVEFLVNFAGIVGGASTIDEITEEDVRRVFAVNFDGTLWTLQAATARMQRLGRGSIVNISSTNGFKSRRDNLTHPYAAAKAAVIGLTMSTAVEAAAHGIRVNCVAPGMHLGPLQLEMARSGDGAENFIEKAIAFTPLGRAGTGADMVGPVRFLLGPDSGFMTGQTIVSDGGRTLWYD